MAPGEGAPEPTAVPGQAHTVLYVEDNLDNLRLVQRILAHRPGIHLLTAMQGSLGTDLARQHRPDLILLDVNPFHDVVREDPRFHSLLRRVGLPR